MSEQDQIQAILNYIANDTNLIAMFRAQITNMLNNNPPAQAVTDLYALIPQQNN